MSMTEVVVVELVERGQQGPPGPVEGLLEVKVISRVIGTPPVSPVAGDRYIVPTGATGVWAGHADALAKWNGAIWQFYPPSEGAITYCLAETRYLSYRSGAWQDSVGVANAALDAIAALTPAANKLAYFTSGTTAALTTLTALGRSLLAGATAGAMQTTLALVPGTDVQAYSGNLASLAGLTLAADKLVYATGVAAFSQTDLSAYGRTLIDDADAAAARVTLGLVIGTNVQAQNANLASLASLTLAADKLLYSTGANTVATADLSVYGRTLIDDANAGAARTTLGVAIGTDVQAYNANLAALAGLTLVANKLAYSTGAGALALTDLSAFGRSLIDDSDAPTALATLGAVPLAGGTMTGALTLNADPSSALHAATKQYVDAVAQGLDAKASVKVASTANLTLSGEQTIDGVVTSASRVLAKNQSTASQNGIWVSAAGAWTRATDADAWTELPGAYCFVEEGTVNGSTGWVCTNTVGGTLGSTSVTFSQFSGAGTYTAGTGLSLTGTQFAISDPELLALAGLTSAPDKVPYFSGSGTAALADFSAYGRTLVDDADAATARGTLGLVIGTNVQAQNANLASLASLTLAADKLLYATGVGTVATADLSAYGRTLIDDADASTARTTLGLGTIATQAASSVALTGGTINGTTIGGTTPAAGTFTNLTVTGTFSFSGSTLLSADGSVGAAGFGFAADPDNGGYRIGTNHWGLAAGGSKIIDIATTGASVTGNLDVSSVIKQSPAAASTLANYMRVNGSNSISSTALNPGLLFYDDASNAFGFDFAYDGVQLATRIFMPSSFDFVVSTHPAGILPTAQSSFTKLFTVFGSGGVNIGAPTGGNKGAGTLNTAGDIYKNNTAYTNPDFVFEHFYCGAITKFAKSPGAAEYAGLMPYSDLREYTRMHLRLPGITDDPMGIFDRGDMALRYLEDNTLRILDLNERLAALEARSA